MTNPVSELDTITGIMPDLALSNGAIGGVAVRRYALAGVEHFHVVAMIRDCLRF